MAKTNPFRWSTQYTDAETDLVMYPARPYNPSTGRFLCKDPIGEHGGQNLCGFVRNNPANFVDPLGLYLSSFPGGPSVFWNDWSQQKRDAWFKDFKDNLGPIINQAANTHCVPKELLSTVIANEMIDYTRREYLQELWGIGDSVGPAQITADTLMREGIYVSKPGMFPLEEREWLRNKLTDAKYNIDAAAQLLKSYLDKLCSAARSGAMTGSFKNDVAPGCNLSDFCCRKGKSCKEMVNYNAPRCLIQALSAVWNNGPKLATDVSDIPNQSPNGYNHGLWAGDLDGIFAP